MADILEFWRGFKRLVLSGASERAKPVGEPTVLTGRAAIAEAGRRTGVHGAGGRGELASAIGLAIAGNRATTWLTEVEPAITLAVEQHVALVAHADFGGGAHRSAEAAGWVCLHPQTVQEAVDLTLVAHHLTEQLLAPVLVAVDRAAVADAVQDVLLPDAEILGDVEDVIPTPTPAQELLFGEERRRLPRFFALDRPVLHGSAGAGLAAASGRAFFPSHVPELLQESLDHVVAHTRRTIVPLTGNITGSIDFMIVARGAAVDVAEGVAAQLRDKERLSVGVLGLRCPALATPEKLTQLLDGVRVAVVLQPAAVLSSPASSSYGSLPGSIETLTAYYDFPGHPLRAADLIGLCTQVRDGRRGDVCLGVSFLPEGSSFPKREVLLQTLRRSYAAVEQMGLRVETGVDLRGAGSLTVAVHRSASAGGHELAGDIGALLGEVVKPVVRSRIDHDTAGYGITCVDWVTMGEVGMRDAGAEVPVDVHVWLPGATGRPERVAEGSAVLVPLVEGAGMSSAPPAVLRDLYRHKVKLYTVEVPAASLPHEDLVPEQVLGGLLGLLQDRGWDLATRRAVTARESRFGHLPQDEVAARVAAFNQGLEQVRVVDWNEVGLAESPQSIDQPVVPLAVRQFNTRGSGYDSVSRFWDQVGVLYRHGQQRQLTPDPYQPIGAVPPLTASFRDLSDERDSLPVFKPESCTGCGDCWTVCPDAAIGATAIGFTGILEAGMAAAKASGQSADALRAVVSKVASRADKLIQEEGSPSTAGPILRSAFDSVLEKMAPPEERRQSLTSAFEALHSQLEHLSLAKAQPFIAHGELLSLAVNAEACKACGACVEVCAEEAFVETPQTDELVTSARVAWSLYEQLPDTSGETIARVASDPDVGRAAAMLLSKHCLMTLSGGDPAEPGSGEKIAVHLALAAAEYHLQPRLQRHLQDVADLEKQFAEKVQELMSGSLPTADLEGLATTLEELGERHVDLSTLTSKVESAPMDAAWLRTLVKTARELGELRYRLSEGVSGMGRARVGLLVAPGNVASWAAAFPFNPFPVPVAVDRSGASAELARGLCLGQMQAVIEDFRLLRRARLELQRPVEAATVQEDSSGMTWRDLTPEERDLCPPLLLIGGEDSLGCRGLSQMAGVLSGDLPIKVLVLTGLDFGLQDESGLYRNAEHTDTPHGDLSLLGLAHRRAYVVQSSVGDADHLVKGYLDAFAYNGPALVHVHTPSPQRHGFATSGTRAQARRALESGVSPRFKYDPEGDGLFGLRLSLQGSPDESRTLADFAASEARFAHHFSPLPDGAPSPTPLMIYLEIEEREGKTPFIEVDGHRLQVSRDLVAASEDRQHSLRVLLELAGLVTPFTDKIKVEAEQQVAATHSSELDALRQEYESKLQGLRAELQEEFTVRLRTRLVELAERNRKATRA